MENDSVTYSESLKQEDAESNDNTESQKAIFEFCLIGDLNHTTPKSIEQGFNIRQDRKALSWIRRKNADALRRLNK